MAEQWKLLDLLHLEMELLGALGMEKSDLSRWIYVLRQQGRLSATTTMPTTYCPWRHENVCREQR